MCFASGNSVKAWCTRYNVQYTKRFGVHGHGEAEAHRLAMYCAQVFSFYYSLYVESGGGRYAHIEEDIVCRPPPSIWLRDKALDIGKVAESMLAIQDIRPRL